MDEKLKNGGSNPITPTNNSVTITATVSGDTLIFNEWIFDDDNSKPLIFDVSGLKPKDPTGDLLFRLNPITKVNNNKSSSSFSIFSTGSKGGSAAAPAAAPPAAPPASYTVTIHGQYTGDTLKLDTWKFDDDNGILYFGKSGLEPKEGNEKGTYLMTRAALIKNVKNNLIDTSIIGYLGKTAASGARGISYATKDAVAATGSAIINSATAASGAVSSAANITTNFLFNQKKNKESLDKSFNDIEIKIEKFSDKLNDLNDKNPQEKQNQKNELFKELEEIKKNKNDIIEFIKVKSIRDLDHYIAKTELIGKKINTLKNKYNEIFKDDNSSGGTRRYYRRNKKTFSRRRRASRRR